MIIDHGHHQYMSISICLCHDWNEGKGEGRDPVVCLVCHVSCVLLIVVWPRVMLIGSNQCVGTVSPSQISQPPSVKLVGKSD